MSKGLRQVEIYSGESFAFPPLRRQANENRLTAKLSRV